MTYFDDLGACDYFGTGGVRLLAIGWLEPGRPHARGPGSSEFFESFARLAINPWQPFATAGRHTCPFCVFTGGPGEIRVGDADVQLGASNVFVPAADAVYVAP